MIGLDSWIIIEVYTRGSRFEKAKNLMNSIEKEVKAFISSMVIAEVKYKLAKKFGKFKANKFIREILTFPNIEILPVSVICLLARVTCL